MIFSSQINSGKFLLRYWNLLLLITSFIIVLQIHNASAMAPTGIIVPLYSQPGPTWDELIQERNAHPSVPIVAVINPDNGPGPFADSNYASRIQHLQSAGITVLGYVYTNYGARSMSDIEADIRSYHSWYHVDGIEFDEMANKGNFESYYSSLSNYVKALGMTMTVGNPGTDTSPSYVGTVDNLIIYDNFGLPSMSSLGGWHTNFTKTNFSIISYGVNSLNGTYVTNATKFVQYMYFTNSTAPNPFVIFPRYLDNLTSILANEQSNISPVTSAGKPPFPENQKMGILEINLLSVTSEREDYHGVSLKIYQDNNKAPFETLDSITGNPYKISLPMGHPYKIEVYVSSMLASVGYVDMESDSKQISFGIPVSGSVRFNVVYNDGSTPIDNATIMIKSDDGTYQYWTNSTTDNSGNTVRYWLEPTISKDDYYVATVLIGSGLSYTYSPVIILPGISGDTQITTPWPVTLPPITVSVYKSPLQKITKSDGAFQVQLCDSHGNKIAQSQLNVLGKTTFSNLKVGKYTIKVINSDDQNDSRWDAINATLDGKQTSFQIFENTNQSDSTNQGNANIAISVTQTDNASGDEIPSWVRNNAKGWVKNQASDSDFVAGIKYMIKEGIVNATDSQANADSSSEQIPSWFKSNTAWWSEGQISDDDFVKCIQWLINARVITI